MKHPLFIAALALALPVAAVAQEENPRISSKLQFNDVLGMPLSNGCHYVATVKGSVTPKSGPTGPVDANVTIDASLACPNKAIIHSVEKFHETAVLTRKELEGALERGASILSDASGTQCVYRPDFRFDHDRLAASKVDVTCPSR